MAVAREAEFLAGEQRRHKFELHAVADVLRGQTVDFVHAHQREVFLTLLRGADRAVHRVAGLQSEEFDLRGRNVDVVGGIEVVVVGRAEESVAVGHDLQNAFALDLACEVVLGDDLLFDGAGCGLFRMRFGCGLGRGGLLNLGLCLSLSLSFGFAAAAFGFGDGLCSLRCRFRLFRPFRGRSCRFGLPGGRYFHRKFGFRCDSGLRRRSGRFGFRQPRTAPARGFLPGFPDRCRTGFFRFFLFLSRFCGSGLLRRGVSGYFRYQFALLDHDVLDAQSLGYFTQFGKAFSFQRFQILHIVVSFNVIFKNRTVARFVRIRLQR